MHVILGNKQNIILFDHTFKWLSLVYTESYLIAKKKIHLEINLTAFVTWALPLTEQSIEWSVPMCVLLSCCFCPC